MTNIVEIIARWSNEHYESYVVNSRGDFECQHCGSTALMLNSASHRPDCKLYHKFQLMQNIMELEAKETE